MKTENLTKSAQQTKNLGRKLAKEVLSLGSAQDRQNNPTHTAGGAFVLALEGDLGGGKTTFLQGFASGFGIKEKILSPTFVIMKKFYVSPKESLRDPTGQASFMFHDFYHIDCYRIKNPKEISELGFEEIISEPKNIIAIEWAGKIKSILPRNCPTIKFGFVDKTKRKITLKNF